MTEQPPNPNPLIDIWKTLRDMSQQMGAVVATTQATGDKVDGLDERLQNVEKCVATIPALEGRVVALEGKVGKANGNGKLAARPDPAPAKTPPIWERVARLVIYAVVIGYALALGYVSFVLPKLQP